MTKLTIALGLALSLLTPFAALAAEATAPAPAAEKHAVATCRDGKTLYSASSEHRGACSGHGGVASWADGSPVKAHGKTTDYR